MNKCINMTCIVCPIGCELTVEKLDDGIRATGNKCSRGIPYAEQEWAASKRIVTTTVRIDDWIYPVIAVKTAQAIPKEKIFDVMNFLSDIIVRVPMQVGDVVVKNILGLGVDIVATTNAVEPSEKLVNE